MYEKLRRDVLPRLIPPSAKILVAVSGGPDSVALSHILWRFVQDNKDNGISLVLSHIHHGVRTESDAEALMVQGLADRWNAPLIIHRFDAKDYAKHTRQSFQAAAREWRYARWAEDMKQAGCTLLATAHHLGDQAETIIYRILRGSGTAGLAGIYPQKAGIIRPLLGVTKAELINYCQQESLPYAIDQSNKEAVYVRNRIRLELIPELEKNYNPRLQYVLGNMAELLRWDEEYIGSKAEEAWTNYLSVCLPDRISLKLNIFTEQPAIFSRIIRKAASQITNEPRGLGFSYIEKIMSSQGIIGWKQNLPGLEVEVKKDGLWFIKADSLGQTENSTGEFAEELRIGEWHNINGVMIGLFFSHSFHKRLDNPGNQTYEDYLNEGRVYKAELDINLLKGWIYPLVFRTRLPGDKMWFRGVGHKALKKVFQEAGIPESERKNIAFLAVGSEVLWIPGVEKSDFCRADEQEKLICIVKMPL